MADNAMVLSSRVRLARNYQDLPFDAAAKPDCAAMCIARTTNAIAISGEAEGFHLVRLSDLSEVRRQALADDHRISRDLMRNPETAAVLIREADAASIMMNEEDHLRIQTIRPGMALTEAAETCFRLEDALSRQVVFAFDKQLGYLTACPTNTGTGMRASLLMHLPMLTLGKQMGNVGQIVAKVGLTIRGVYGEGAEALGNLYQVSNQVTLGRTEQEIISTVTAVGHQLTDMEQALREKTAGGDDSRLALEDAVYRAWGMMRFARLMPLNEFFRHWSNVRLGAAMGLLPAPLALLDTMLDQAQDANLSVFNEQVLAGNALSAARARRVRGMLAAYQ